jgi:hypothetical protein
MEIQKPKNKIFTWLFNPFYYLAGGKAFVIGLVIMFISGIIAYFSRSHFDGVLDFHIGASTPIWFNLVEVIVDWVSLVIPLIVTGLIISKTRFRVIDVFGTQALARYPAIFMTVTAFVPGYQELIAKLMVVTPIDAAKIISENIGGLVILMAISIIIMIFAVWMIALMYRAFAVSCNVSGWKAIVGFIIAILIGEVISKIVIYGIWYCYHG